MKNKSRDPREVISKTSLLSFPQSRMLSGVGNLVASLREESLRPSDSPLEKGDEGGCLRKIPDKSDADLREESRRPE